MGFLIIIWIVVIIIAIASISSGNSFRNNSQKVEEGMSKEEVLSLMGDPTFTKKHQDGSYEYVYEKSEWKGYLRGGTKTRRMEIVFSAEDKVISVGRNKNCEMSGW